MRVVVIDGQGGSMGRMLVTKIKEAALPCELIAVGTNSIAAAAMLKAGADAAASGENPVLVAGRTADVIIGPVGILAADAMLGEITPAMAVAIGQSPAKKLLLPVNLCNHIIIGAQAETMGGLIDKTVDYLRTLVSHPSAQADLGC